MSRMTCIVTSGRLLERQLYSSLEAGAAPWLPRRDYSCPAPALEGSVFACTTLSSGRELRLGAKYWAEEAPVAGDG